jgi:periplasmic glucans biosynthesis protein
MTAFSRRDLLLLMTALGLVPVVGPASAQTVQPGNLRFADAVPFSFDGLVAEAKALAEKPYVPEIPRAADVLETIDYDQHWRIKFKAENTLPVDGGKAPIRLFHLGRYFKLPVGIHLVENGQARQLQYSPELFEMPADSPAKQLPADIGFAGFRVLEPGSDRDWLAFLGAAYFRSSGELDQFGMSARALAIDVAMPTPEEFPRFTDFFFAPSANAGRITIFCRLNSPRITGALQMDIAKNGAVVMDIAARFFARESMQRVGLAPLTSMFWYSETGRERGVDWRPEVHDSDGLAIWTGAGERLWRPLNNPPQVMTSSFSDQSPRGFGLLQRDRNFENYEDDGVFYEKRASVWVEPRGDWGAGVVQLVEIPTDDEIHDNIAAYWVAQKPVNKGDAISIDYRLFWSNDEPYRSGFGEVIATRYGRGGVPGQPRPPGVFKFAVDFAGGALATLGKEDRSVEAVVTASSGTVLKVDAYANKGDESWRAIFDLQTSGSQPVELRLFLRKGGETLTETWAYQFAPPAPRAG